MEESRTEEMEEAKGDGSPAQAAHFPRGLRVYSCSSPQSFHVILCYSQLLMLDDSYRATRTVY